MSTVLKLAAGAVWRAKRSPFQIVLIFALLGLLASLVAVLNGVEIAGF